MKETYSSYRSRELTASLRAAKRESERALALALQRSHEKKPQTTKTSLGSCFRALADGWVTGDD